MAERFFHLVVRTLLLVVMMAKDLEVAPVTAAAAALVVRKKRTEDGLSALELSLSSTPLKQMDNKFRNISSRGHARVLTRLAGLGWCTPADVGSNGKPRRISRAGKHKI